MLYLYLPPNGVDLLETGQIMTSVPTSLNDPFDFRLGFVDQMDDQEVVRQLSTNHVLLKVIQDALGEKGFTREQVVATIRAEPLRHAEVLRKAWPKIVAEFADKFSQDADCWRLLCFSLRNDGILLWSHYANRHRGFVVAFDKEMMLSGLPPEAHFPVQYRSNRPHAKSIFVEGDDLMNLLRSVVKIKSLEWAYEEEYRVLWPSDSLKTRNDSVRHYCPFNSAVLRQVILGPDCSDETKERIQRACAHPRYSHVQLLKANRHPYAFKMEISP